MFEFGLFLGPAEERKRENASVGEFVQNVEDQFRRGVHGGERDVDGGTAGGG